MLRNTLSILFVTITSAQSAYAVGGHKGYVSKGGPTQAAETPSSDDLKETVEIFKIAQNFANRPGCPEAMKKIFENPASLKDTTSLSRAISSATPCINSFSAAKDVANIGFFMNDNIKSFTPFAMVPDSLLSRSEARYTKLKTNYLKDIKTKDAKSLEAQIQTMNADIDALMAIKEMPLDSQAAFGKIYVKIFETSAFVKALQEAQEDQEFKNNKKENYALVLDNSESLFKKLEAKDPKSNQTKLATTLAKALGDKTPASGLSAFIDNVLPWKKSGAAK